MAFVAAAAAAGASLIGSGLDYKQNKDNARQQEKNRQTALAILDKSYDRGRAELTPAYNKAQDARQTGINRNLALTGETFSPLMENIREGGNMSRDALLVGRENSRNAVLGNEVDYGALRNQPMTDRTSALTGLTNPDPVAFQQMEGVEMAGDFTSGDIQSYLTQNPDIAQDYEINKAALMEGGDPQFATLEGFAKFHYDNYGKQEIEAGTSPARGILRGQTDQAYNSRQAGKSLMEWHTSPPEDSTGIG